MTKWAVKIAYLGEGFFGSQFQPHRRTVEGEVRSALDKLGYGSQPAFASRTDRGVSALCNVFCYEGKKPILGQLNSKLPSDIVAWAYTCVGKDFACRDAKMRHYRYFLPDKGYLKSRVEKALGRFVGETRLHNFSLQKPNGKFFIEKARVAQKGGYFVLDIWSKSFLRGMIRKIAYAVEAVAAGEWNLNLLEQMFDSAFSKGVPPAPPEGLVLMDIRYSKLRFTSERKWLKGFRKLASARLQQAAVLGQISE